MTLFFPQFCGYVLRNLTTESQKRHALSWKKKNNNENGIMKMTQNELRSIKITFPFGSHHYLVYFLSKCQHTTTKEYQTHDVEWPNVTNTSIEPKQTHNFSLVIIDKKKIWTIYGTAEYLLVISQEISSVNKSSLSKWIQHLSLVAIGKWDEFSTTNVNITFGFVIDGMSCLRRCRKNYH